MLKIRILILGANLPVRWAVIQSRTVGQEVFGRSKVCAPAKNGRQAESSRLTFSSWHGNKSREAKFQSRPNFILSFSTAFHFAEKTSHTPTFPFQRKTAKSWARKVLPLIEFVIILAKASVTVGFYYQGTSPSLKREERERDLRSQGRNN